MKVKLYLYNDPNQLDSVMFLRMIPHIYIKENLFIDNVIMKTMSKIKLSKYPQISYWNNKEVEIPDNCTNIEELLSNYVVELQKSKDTKEYIFEVVETDDKILFRFVKDFIFLSKFHYSKKIKEITGKDIEFVSKINHKDAKVVKSKIYQIENGSIIKKIRS